MSAEGCRTPTGAVLTVCIQPCNSVPNAARKGIFRGPPGHALPTAISRFQSGFHATGACAHAAGCILQCQIPASPAILVYCIVLSSSSKSAHYPLTAGNLGEHCRFWGSGLCATPNACMVQDNLERFPRTSEDTLTRSIINIQVSIACAQRVVYSRNSPLLRLLHQ